MKITVTNNAFPDDHVFYVDGLPPLPNGAMVDLSEDDIARFEARSGIKLADAFKSQEGVKLTTSGGKGGN